MVQREEMEQVTLFSWATWQEQLYPDLKWMYHVPNGGKRNKATAARLKAAGVKAGVPDVVLPTPKGIYHGLYIEMKSGDNKPTAKQKEWLEYLKSAGYKTAVCYSYEEAIDVILAYLKQ